MACKIESVTTVNGKESKLFQNLSEIYEQEIALGKYISIINNFYSYEKLYGLNEQGEPNFSPNIATKFKKDEFSSTDEQLAVVDMLATFSVDVIKSLPGVADDSVISGINMQALNNVKALSGRIVTDVRKRISSVIAENPNLSDAKKKVLENAAKNLPSYLVSDSRAGIVGRVLREYGINFTIKSSKDPMQDVAEEMENSDVDFDLELAEIQNERIYDMETTEQSMINSISPATKAYLRGKRQVAEDYKLSSGERIRYEKTVISTHKPVDSQKLISTLSGILVGVQTVPEMVERLKEKADSNPIIVPVLQDILEENALGGVTLKTNTSTIKYKPISTSIFATFSKADYNMYTITKTREGNVLLLPANRSSVSGLIKSRMAREITKLQESGVDYSNKIKTLETFAKKLARTRLDNKTIKLISNHFRAAGLYFMTPEVIKEIDTTLKTNPPAKLTKDGKPKTGLILNTLYRGVLIPALKGEDVLKSTSENFGETKLLNFIIGQAAKFKTDDNAGAFRSNSGKTVHPFNKSSESQDLINRLKNDEAYLNSFLQDPIYENSVMLNEMMTNNDPDMLRQYTMDTVADSSISNSGLKHGKQSSFDALVSKIVGFVSTPSVPTVFYAASPTFADRGTSMSITVPKLNVLPDGTDKPVIKTIKGKSSLDSPEISGWIRNQISSEMSRIIAAKNSSINYKNYSDKNAGKIMLFEQLNDLLPLSELTSSNKEQFLDDAMVHMDTIIPQIISQDIQTLKDNYILDSGDIESKIGQPIKYKTTRNANQFLPNAFKNPTRAQVENLIMNNLIYGYEQLLMYAGDLAFYKSKVDINKRLGLSTTPGDKLATGDGSGVNPTYKLKITSEPLFSSENKYLYDGLFDSSIYKNPTKDRARLFNEIELADGSGFASPRRYKELLIGQGLHTQETIEYLDALTAWKPGQKPVIKGDNVVTPVLKGFNWQLQANADNVIVPTSQKYSLMLVQPDYFEATDNRGLYKHSGMAKISQELREGRADEVAVQSAVKVGVNNTTNLDGLSNAPATVMRNNSYRFPQAATSKQDTETRWGGQIRKIIAANLSAAKSIRFRGELQSEESARVIYENTIKEIIKDASLNLTNDYIKNGKLDESVIRESLLRSLDQGGLYKNVEYFEEALEEFDNGTFLPLNYPTMSFATDSMVNSAYKSRVHKVKTPGYQAVQVTSMGMSAEKSKGEISTNTDLKFVGIEKINGTFTGSEAEIKTEKLKYIERIKNGEDVSSEITVTPAEVRVTPKYFKNTIDKLASERVPRNQFDDTLKELRKTIKKYQPELTNYEVSRQIKEARNAAIATAVELEANKLMSNIKDASGQYTIEKIKKNAPELLDLLLYRIPTQAKSSMLPAKIIGFLPEALSSTIQVPAEIVEQAGSDFDIDKVFISTRGIKVDEQGNLRNISKDDLKETLFDFQHAVLSSPNHMKDLLLPTSTVQLEKVMEEFGITDALYTGNIGSLSIQEAFRDNNKKGKELISIFSIASTAHSVAPYIGVRPTKPVTINGKPLTLSRRTIYDSNTNISDLLKELQNAALDNANDPLLGKLNVDSYTSSVVSLLVSSGHPLKYALSVVNAPIVKDLATMLPTFEKFRGKKGALDAVKAELRKKYRIPKRRGKDDAINIASYTLEKAEANRNADPTNSIAFANSQREALGVFLALEKIGSGLSSFQVAMNFDSGGPQTSATGLIKQIDNLRNIPGTVSNREMGLSRDNPAVFEVSPKMYDAHSLSSYEKYGLHGPSKVNELSSLAASKVGQKALTLAIENIGPMTDTQQMHFLSEFNTYISHTEGVYSDSTSGIAKMIKNNEHVRLITKGDGNSLASQIDAYIKRQEQQGKPINLFIQQLQIANRENNSFVFFNNTKFKALTGSTKAGIMRAFEELMESKEPMNNLLAKSIADYAAIFYGYSTSVNSFMELLPPSAHVEYMGKMEGKSLPEFFRDIKDNLNDESKFSKINNDYVDHYVAKNGSKLNLLRLTPEQKGERLMLNDLPTYYMVYNQSSKQYITEKNGAQILQTTKYPEFVKTYEVGKSETDILKAQSSIENKGALANMNSAFGTFKHHIVDLMTMPIEDGKDASENSKAIVDRVTALLNKQELDPRQRMELAEIDNFRGVGSRVAFMHKRGKLETEGIKSNVSTIDRYSVQTLRNNLDKIYIFGDNMMRRGTGGQAQVRYSPNSYGIRTKMEPSNYSGAFMSDSKLENNKKAIDEDISRILSDGRPIVFPKDGIGTGLARLKTKAPETYTYLKKELKNKFGFDNDTGKVVDNSIKNAYQKLLSEYIQKFASFEVTKILAQKIQDCN